MIRQKFNFLTEIALAITFVIVVATAYSGRLDIHPTAGKTLIVLIAVHLLLHFDMIVAMGKNFFKK